LASTSTNPVFVRTAGRGDVAAIQSLLVDTWHHTYDSIYGSDRVSEITREWHSVAALERRLAMPESEFIVADDGRRILGIAFALAHGDHADLKQLYVAPDAQRRGIGTLLLQEILDSFDEAHAVLLEVEAENGAALAFYRKHGFVEQAHSDHCNGEPGFATILLGRAL
jgi:ribosomal protein S18 acetylase RimI-like enzyme